MEAVAVAVVEVEVDVEVAAERGLSALGGEKLPG